MRMYVCSSVYLWFIYVRAYCRPKILMSLGKICILMTLFAFAVFSLL